LITCAILNSFYQVMELAGFGVSGDIYQPLLALSNFP
jgi:hypothetical protein